MGGFINGIKHRIPGAKVICMCCGERLPEECFTFAPSKGYFPYCRPCHNKKQMKKRKGDAYVNGKPNQGRLRAKRNQEILPDVISVTQLAQIIRVGQVFHDNGEAIIIKTIQVGGVYMEHTNGRLEMYQWDEMLKLYREEKESRREYAKSKKQESRTTEGTEATGTTDLRTMPEAGADRTCGAGIPRAY